MAVIFRPVNKPAITIGGTTGTGPFPRYSLGREVISTDDGSTIGNRYTISISGAVITDSNADISISGEMQSNLHSKIIQRLQANINNGENIGRLEIAPYGGLPNVIEFANARLTGIDIPEQSEESSGVLFSDYTFNFEAYEDISNRASDGKPILTSAEESWEINIDEDASYINSVFSADPVRTYTITHTVSATGVRRVVDDVVVPAWKEAAEWVKTRLVSTPATEILKDMSGSDIEAGQRFNPLFMDTSASSLSTNLSGLNFYNHSRVPQPSISTGSYSITETWKASPISATVDMEINLDVDDTGVTNASLTGTIVGLETNSVNNRVIKKLENAEPILLNIEAAAYNLCKTYHSPLISVVRSKSIGRNKGTGTITFSFTFNDMPVLLDGAISTNISITDDNEHRLSRVIAVIPIIAKPTGPVIQDMHTTPERKRSVQLDAVMNRENRVTKPAAAVPLVLSYAPTGGYLQTISENWEPNTGTYSINVDWVY